VAQRLGPGWGPVVAAAAALVALSACGDDDGAAGETTTTTSSTTTEAATTTTTTEVIDPTTVPAEITEEYVQAVLDELYAVQGEALRMAVDEGVVSGAVLSSLGTIYSESEARRVANAYIDAAAGGFSEVKRPPGDPQARVESVLTATAGCLFVRTTLDFEAVATASAEPAVVFVHLVPADQNATPWRIETLAAVGPDGVEPSNPCGE
jgi:hypothetical protein